jgi:hypothetical protein
MKITYKSEIIFLGIYFKGNLKRGTHAQLLRANLYKVEYVIRELKEMSPYITNIYYLNLESCLRYGIMGWR